MLDLRMVPSMKTPWSFMYLKRADWIFTLMASACRSDSRQPRSGPRSTYTRPVLESVRAHEQTARASGFWTNRTQEAWVYSHDGPIKRREHGYRL
eukprot:1606930-Pyramimonas_sp.AAC.1